MLENILRWVAAGDSAIVTMGPVAAIALAMLGGAGVTQAAKFLLVELVPERWEKFAIRVTAIAATFVLLHLLADLVLALELVVAFAQPFAYLAFKALVRNRWPWLEATRAVGSVRPSEEARAALEQRRAGP